MRDKLNIFALRRLHCHSIDLSTVDPSISPGGTYGGSYIGAGGVGVSSATNFTQTANSLGQWGSVLTGLVMGSKVTTGPQGTSITPSLSTTQQTLALKSQQSTMIIVLVIAALFLFLLMGEKKGA